MNKISIVIVCLLLMILTTGCGGLFDSIEKDTVMVKKLTAENKNNEVEYEGVLSQEAVKTLSLNAVNKYYDEQLSMDEVQFELMAVDGKKLNDLLLKLEYVIEPRPSLNQSQTQKEIQEFKPDSEKMLKQISGGLFYMTLTKEDDPYEVYDLVMNAKDGDVLKIIKLNQKQNGAYSDRFKKDTLTETSEIANRFIQEKGSYARSDLTLYENATSWETNWGTVVELFYRSKDKKSLIYSVIVNVRTMQVVGFNKDVMSLFSYYSGTPFTFKVSAADE